MTYLYERGLRKERDRWVYILVDPRDSRIRYVGASVDPHKRVWGHMIEARKPVKTEPSEKRLWLRDLDNNGLKPVMARIEKCTPLTWRRREDYWIIKLRNAGADLLNIHTWGYTNYPD